MAVPWLSWTRPPEPIAIPSRRLRCRSPGNHPVGILSTTGLKTVMKYTSNPPRMPNFSQHWPQNLVESITSYQRLQVQSTSDTLDFWRDIETSNRQKCASKSQTQTKRLERIAKWRHCTHCRSKELSEIVRRPKKNTKWGIQRWSEWTRFKRVSEHMRI